eukprot:TRINITY_DN67619_c0_g1_i1.p1 TRINITY_DN67619_c0_g1~~TRINITY_DN67619_c0_g1_i1.p1  ORF type:complete len:1358 (+),score=325.11 TRINITY_DN67619_c0_g1_i1:301-4374(+)
MPAKSLIPRSRALGGCRMRSYNSHRRMLMPSGCQLQHNTSLSPLGMSFRNYQEIEGAEGPEGIEDDDRLAACRRALAAGINTFTLPSHPPSALRSFQWLGPHISAGLRTRGVVFSHIGFDDRGLSDTYIPKEILATARDVRKYPTEKAKYFSTHPDWLAFWLRQARRAADPVVQSGACDFVVMLDDPHLAIFDSEHPGPAHYPQNIPTASVEHIESLAREMSRLCGYTMEQALSILPITVYPTAASKLPPAARRRGILEGIRQAAAFLEPLVARGIIAAWGINVTGRYGHPSALFDDASLADIVSAVASGRDEAFAKLPASHMAQLDISSGPGFRYVGMPFNISEHEAVTRGYITEAKKLGLRTVGSRPLCTVTPEAYEHRWVEYVRYGDVPHERYLHNLVSMACAVENGLAAECASVPNAPPPGDFAFSQICFMKQEELNNAHACARVRRKLMERAYPIWVRLVHLGEVEIVRLVEHHRRVLPLLLAAWMKKYETRHAVVVDHAIIPRFRELVPAFRKRPLLAAQMAMSVALSAGFDTITTGLKSPLYVRNLVDADLPLLGPTHLDTVLADPKLDWHVIGEEVAEELLPLTFRPPTENEPDVMDVVNDVRLKYTREHDIWEREMEAAVKPHIDRMTNIYAEMEYRYQHSRPQRPRVWFDQDNGVMNMADMTDPQTVDDMPMDRLEESIRQDINFLSTAAEGSTWRIMVRADLRAPRGTFNDRLDDHATDHQFGTSHWDYHVQDRHEDRIDRFKDAFYVRGPTRLHPLPADGEPMPTPKSAWDEREERVGTAQKDDVAEWAMLNNRNYGLSRPPTSAPEPSSAKPNVVEVNEASRAAAGVASPPGEPYGQSDMVAATGRDDPSRVLAYESREDPMVSRHFQPGKFDPLDYPKVLPPFVKRKEANQADPSLRDEPGVHPDRPAPVIPDPLQAAREATQRTGSLWSGNPRTAAEAVHAASSGSQSEKTVGQRIVAGERRVGVVPAAEDHTYMMDPEHVDPKTPYLPERLKADASGMDAAVDTSNRQQQMSRIPAIELEMEDQAAGPAGPKPPPKEAAMPDEGTGGRDEDLLQLVPLARQLYGFPKPAGPEGKDPPMLGIDMDVEERGRVREQAESETFRKALNTALREQGTKLSPDGPYDVSQGRVSALTRRHTQSGTLDPDATDDEMTRVAKARAREVSSAPTPPEARMRSGVLREDLTFRPIPDPAGVFADNDPTRAEGVRNIAVATKEKQQQKLILAARMRRLERTRQQRNLKTDPEHFRQPPGAAVAVGVHPSKALEETMPAPPYDHWLPHTDPMYGEPGGLSLGAFDAENDHMIRGKQHTMRNDRMHRMTGARPIQDFAVSVREKQRDREFSRF